MALSGAVPFQTPLAYRKGPLAIQARRQLLGERIDVVLEPNPLADLQQVRLAHTPI
jgi:hypothetical protein